MPNFIDRTGQKFNELTVIKRSANNKKQICWLCLCDCGNTVVVQGGNLGRNKNCGHNKASHGLSNTVEHRTYDWMHDRCKNPNYKRYKDYGGRGIKVCSRWSGVNGFINFLTDMGQRPSSKHSIDRINNNSNYEPNNCKWATRKEQSNNRRYNVFLTHEGITLNATQWAKRIGVSGNLIRRRLKDGWSDHDALTRPVRKIVRT